MLLPACTRFGAKRVQADRFSYNEAIARSQKEQMLLNLVRLRYRDLPEFLSVSSVLTQYNYTGTVGTQGAERPTITYTPLAGSQFSRRMLSPIPVEMMFAASQGGWDTNLLMLIALPRCREKRGPGHPGPHR